MNIFSKTFWNRKRTEKELEKYSEPDTSFFILMFFSSAIATLGLILNSVAIIVGAMVIAPIVTPIFGFSLNFLILQIKDTLKATWTAIVGTLVGIATSFTITWIIDFFQTIEIKNTAQIIARIEPGLLHLFVAIFSGMVGAYAYSKPDLQERIVGIAISVALIPPLATIGLGLALTNPDIWQGSSLLYLTNLAGIAFGSIVTFAALGFGQKEELSESVKAS